MLLVMVFLSVIETLIIYNVFIIKSIYKFLRDLREITYTYIHTHIHMRDVSIPGWP